jgi:hypothetical protein
VLVVDAGVGVAGEGATGLGAEAPPETGVVIGALTPADPGAATPAAALAGNSDDTLNVYFTLDLACRKESIKRASKDRDI